MSNNTVGCLYEKLKESLKDGTVSGNVSVNLAGIQCIIKGKDAVGHLMQEWFFDWCKVNNFKVIPNPNTQKFPDYYIDHVGNDKGMLEIKNFNIKKTPAFDVADLYAFIETLPNNIEKLFADYIVFGYDLKSNGELSIPKVWNFKIWEIVGKSKENNITCQIRKKLCIDENNKVLRNGNIDLKGRLQKFRPYNFKKDNHENEFTSPLEFLEALQNLLDHHHATKDDYSNWLDRVKKSYFDKYKENLK